MHKPCNFEANETVKAIDNSTLVINKTSNVDAINPGDLFNYTIVITAGGSSDSLGVILTDKLDQSLLDAQNAIHQVQTNIQSVGNQVGMSSQAVINAIQSGNTALASQLSQCCCDNKLLITTQGYENRIANGENTALLGSKIDAQTVAMNNQFCALKEREMQSRIDALLEKNSTLEATISNANQTAQIQSYIASVVTPLAQDVAAIKASQPNTVSVPYPQLTAIPTASLYGYGINTGSIWS